jgi:hypothetical protein
MGIVVTRRQLRFALLLALLALLAVESPRCPRLIDSAEFSQLTHER